MDSNWEVDINTNKYHTMYLYQLKMFGSRKLSVIFFWWVCKNLVTITKVILKYQRGGEYLYIKILFQRFRF